MAYLSVVAKSSKVRTLITAGVLIPYWISMLVRIFAWQVILQNNGLVNQALMFFGITKAPVKLLYNLLMASSIMGATKFYGFIHVFLPLSKPGILSGSIMVFVLSLGFYIAPALLGGPDNMMLSNLIETSMTNFNWGLASALSVELLVLVYAIIALTFRLTGNIFVKQY